MAVQILISPPAGGKTQTVIERVLATTNQDMLASVRVVLPDGLQTGYFRRRLSAAGGVIGVQVGTFGNFYQELLEQAGQPVPITPDAITYRLVQAAIDDVYRQNELNYYLQLRSMPGFALALLDLFAEFKRALVDPQALLEIAQERSPNFLELAKIYDRYQGRLQALNWADPEGLSWLAVEALDNQPLLGSDLNLLVVDGFDSFVASQLKTLQLLADRVRSIVITLPGDSAMDRPAHRRFALELDKLRKALHPEILTAEGQPHLTSELAWLEKNLFETGAQTLNEVEHIRLIEARSPSEEAREALRWLKARLIRDGVKVGDCALVVPDMDVYRPHLRMAADEYGMKLRFTLEESLAAAPPVAVLLDLLALPLHGYPRRMLLDTLRSPYLDLHDFGLDLSQVDMLEVASLFGQVVEGLDQWLDTLTDLAGAHAEESDDLDETEASYPTLPTGSRAVQLRDSLESFTNRLGPPPEKLSMGVWVRWLQDLLDDLGYLRNPDLDRDQAARSSLEGILRSLGMSSVVAGSRALDYGDFVAELQGAFQGARFGIIPEQTSLAGPAIIVQRVLEARGVRYQAVVILGLAEGVYPQPERTDPFFGEADRRRFGLEPRLDRQQAGVFYQAVTRTDRFLLLTRPYLASDGESWEPSPYWNEVRKLLPEPACRMVRPDDLRPLEEAGSAQELLFWSVNDAFRFGQGLPDRYKDLLQRWQQLGYARTVLDARMSKNAAGPFEGMPEELQQVFAAKFGGQHTWSASRLETYGSCPFRFYVEVALSLQPKLPPQLGLDASQLGSLLHAILEQAYRYSADPADPDMVVAEMHKIAAQAFREAPRTYGFRPSVLWDRQQELWTAALEKTVRAILDYGPKWRPSYFEARFGSGDQPTLVIETDLGPLRLRGVIDRVDRSPEGELRIVDYKTGSSHLSPVDLVNGVRLQLPLYALAAEKALNLGKVVEGLYWKILKAEPGTLKLAAFAYDDAYQGIEGAYELVEDHVNRFVKGIRSAEYPPEPPKGGCPNYCAAAIWCWRYSPSSY